MLSSNHNMKQNNKKKKKKIKSNKGNSSNNGNRWGMDTILNKHGKGLRKGEFLHFTLIKGPSINQEESKDPVNANAPKEFFPLVAKFSESVIKPNFMQSPWKEARLYQQDVPKAEIDSDEEEEEAKAVLANTKRRYKRGRRNDAPKRQWVLQEEPDFLETLAAKRRKKRAAAQGGAAAAAALMTTKGKLSTRYEGLPEHNPSHYILMQVTNARRPGGDDDDDDTSPNGNNTDSLSGLKTPSIKVTLLPNPPNVTINFSQPAVRKTLSMTEAEQAMQDQRSKFSDQKSAPFAPVPANPVSKSKSRLMDKFTKSAAAARGEDDDVADDVMADVAFRERKGGGASRRELLTSLGDEAVTVDEDGVLGGANDEEFGGRRRFGRFKVPSGSNKAGAGGAGDGTDQDGLATTGGDAANSGKDKGNAGMAMEDGFYQRDVGAEYEELDFDANEQFDDDDVDLGETEVMVDTGLVQDVDDDDDVEEDIDVGGDGAPSGLEGLASTAGFKAMLAKARGETSATPDGGAQDGKDGGNNADSSPGDAEKTDGQISDGGDKKEAEISPPVSPTTPNNIPGATPPSSLTTETDSDGLRLITLEAVRKEIWLHHGSIGTNRLMKLFSVNKRSSKERQGRFRDVIKELCTIKESIKGRLLVLKQHYSSMG